MRGIVLELVGETLRKEYGGAPWLAPLAGAAAVAGNGSSAGAGRATPAHGGPPAEVEDSTPSDALVCWLGLQAVATMAERYPSLFRMHPGLRSFLRSLDGDPGPGSAAGGAGLSPLRVRLSVDGELLISLPGGGRGCVLLKGVVAGAAAHYGERARIEELKCACRGDNRCVLRVVVGGRASLAADGYPDGEQAVGLA